MQHRNRFAPLAGSAAAVVLVTAAIYLFREAVPVLSLGSSTCSPSFRSRSCGAGLGGIVARSRACWRSTSSSCRRCTRSVWRTHELACPRRLSGHRHRGQRARGACPSRARPRPSNASARRPCWPNSRSRCFRASSLDERLRPDRPSAPGRVLGVDRARLELGDGAEPGRESGARLAPATASVGRLVVPDGERPDAAVGAPFSPRARVASRGRPDREELQREALEAERLRLSDSVKTAILRAVGHDLRSPLTAIRVAGESLASPSLRAHRGRPAAPARDTSGGSRRLDRLVANLLDLSRLETGAADFHGTSSSRSTNSSGRRSPDFGGRMRVRSRSSCRRRDPARGGRLRSRSSAPWSTCSRTGCASRPRTGPSSSGSPLRRARSSCVSTNGGPAIAERDLERIFEPFVRASGDEGRQQGTGLGLAIARGFTEANGGRIWAESPPDRRARALRSLSRCAVPVGREA